MIKQDETSALTSVVGAFTTSKQLDVDLIDKLISLLDGPLDVSFSRTFLMLNGYSYQVRYSAGEDYLTFVNLFTQDEYQIQLSDISAGSQLEILDGFTYNDILMNLNESYQLTSSLQEITMKMAVDNFISVSDALSVIDRNFDDKGCSSYYQLSGIITQYPYSLTPKDWMAILEQNYTALRNAVTNETFQLDTTKGQIATFIGGVITGVVTSIGTLVSAVLTVINPILGVIALGITTFLQTILNIVAPSEYKVDSLSPNRLLNIPIGAYKLAFKDDWYAKVGVVPGRVKTIQGPFFVMYIWGRGQLGSDTMLKREYVYVNVYLRVSGDQGSSVYSTSGSPLNDDAHGYIPVYDVSRSGVISGKARTSENILCLSPADIRNGSVDSIDITTTGLDYDSMTKLVGTAFFAYLNMIMSAAGDLGEGTFSLNFVSLGSSIANHQEFLNSWAGQLNLFYSNQSLNLPNLIAMMNYLQQHRYIGVENQELAFEFYGFMEDKLINWFDPESEAYATRDSCIVDYYSLATPRSFCLAFPAYTSEAALKTALVCSLATVGTAAAVMGVSYGVKRLGQRYQLRASNSAKNAYDAYQANPTVANETAYLNELQKYNVKARIFGWDVYEAGSCLPSAGSPGTVAATAYKSDMTSISENIEDVKGLIRS